jgi:hypothetical protein
VSQNLARMWQLAVRANGKTLKQAIAEMNAATGRRYSYVRVWEWVKGRARVPLDARPHMLEVALPFILKCVAVKLPPADLKELREMLR